MKFVLLLTLLSACRSSVDDHVIAIDAPHEKQNSGSPVTEPKLMSKTYKNGRPHFCVVDNVRRDEPPSVKVMEYVHIKARSDGNQTAIATVANCPKESQEMSYGQMQSQLDKWTEADGSEHLYLGAFFDKNGTVFKPVVLEAMSLSRIRRRRGTDRDALELTTQRSFAKMYPLSTSPLSPAELEDLHDALKAAIGERK